MTARSARTRSFGLGAAVAAVWLVFAALDPALPLGRALLYGGVAGAALVALTWPSD